MRNGFLVAFTPSMASKIFTAPSKSTFFARSSPPFPPAPALKYTISALVLSNRLVKSAAGASSKERSFGVAPVEVMSCEWDGSRMIEVTVWFLFAKSFARRRATYSHDSSCQK